MVTKVLGNHTLGGADGLLQVFTGVFGMLGPQKTDHVTKTIGATKADMTMAILVVAEYCLFV